MDEALRKDVNAICARCGSHAIFHSPAGECVYSALDEKYTGLMGQPWKSGGSFHPFSPNPPGQNHLGLFRDLQTHTLNKLGVSVWPYERTRPVPAQALQKPAQPPCPCDIKDLLSVGHSSSCQWKLTRR